MSLLDTALALAAGGVEVFPVGVDKSPRTPHGFKDATTDAETIRNWRWDDVLIGAAVAPGTIVVDIDPRNGGDETINALAELGQVLPATRAVRTRSGGRHLIYTVPEGIELRGIMGPGVDIKRAGKGYVVAPPSPGYRRIESMKPVAAPDWLLEELVVVERAGGADAASAPKFFPFESGTAYGLAALERAMGRLGMALDGERNNTLFKEACNLSRLVAGGELDVDRVRNDLLTGAERIGLDEGEAFATIESGWAAGEQEPRQAPPREGESVPAAEAHTIPATDAGVNDGEPKAHPWVNWDVDEPLPPFYCHPILPKNAYVLVYGPTEAAKSMTWLGVLTEGSHLGVKSSLYSLENPPALDRDRLRRWAPNPKHLRLTNEPIDCFDQRQVEALIAREKEWGTDVVFIDTYSYAFSARTDDGNAKAISFAKVVRYIMTEVGCSVVAVDHTGFQGDEPRDASAKRQMVDVAILMNKAGEWKFGEPAKFTMLNRKSARFGNPFRLAGAIHDVKPDRGLELRWPDKAPEWVT